MDYLNKGIRVTLNTDDMGIEGTTLAEEFRYMERTYGLTREQEEIILNNSIDAAFTMMCHLLENNYITFKKKVSV